MWRIGLMTDKEKNLLGACLKGEKSAWDSFVLQYSGLVYHTIKKTFSHYHTEPRSDVVEDLYQEFFLSVIGDDFKKLRQFRGERGCSLASWLRVVAARLTIDFLRKPTTPSDNVTEIIPSNQPDPSDSLIDQEEEKLLSQTLETFPPRDKLFIGLCFEQGLSPQDIASILRISVSAVYTQKSRIVDKLWESLRKTGAL